jgi:hypothetical protein
MALMAYPTKSKTILSSDEERFEVFVNNTHTLREMFFTNTMVRRVWNKVSKMIREEEMFEEDQNLKEMRLTYC